MFTTGSKLFLGATAVSAIGAVLWAASTGGAAGVMGTVGLVFVAAVFALLAGLNFYTRDGNVPGNTPDPDRNTAAGQRPVGASMWPLVVAVGAGGLVVGVISRPVVFKVSLVVLLAALVEWMVQGFSERASADARYNDGIRKRLLHPLEFPILGAAIGVVVVYGFSRVMLSASKDAGKIIFIMLGAILLFAGFLIAGRRGLAKNTSIGIAVVGGVALLSVGVVSAISGQRAIDPHPLLTSAICLGTGSPEQEAELDKKTSESVAAKSAVSANVVLTNDNRLVAFVNGIPNVEYHELTVGRSTDTRVLFRNETGLDQRLAARLGTFVQKDGTKGSENAVCTVRIRKGGEAFLTFKIAKSQAASSTPYQLMVPGLDGRVIALVVP
ncbi:MAG: hypothetical protein WCI22_07810 [Actinomycetota bacterium]